MRPLRNKTPSIMKINKMNRTTTNQANQCINQVLHDDLSHWAVLCGSWTKMVTTKCRADCGRYAKRKAVETSVGGRKKATICVSA